jgi:hypothetical protein
MAPVPSWHVKHRPLCGAGSRRSIALGAVWEAWHEAQASVDSV